MSLQVGKVIQNYRLVRFLGDGGMGSVWLAEHTLLQRQVAIKSLHGNLLRNQGIRDRFKNEAATLAHLQHPCIVALIDYIEETEQSAEGAYLIMEFVDGMALDDYIREVTGPIPEQELRSLFGQILEGFVYAHGKRIVHRDIKPGNFLITPEGKAKILDFGIAKILGDGDRKLTKTGTNMGTVLFMSPEQVKGQPVDQRSDIYALGVTLFQMATGRNPYAADMTEFYVYDQIVNHPLPPAHEFYPGVSPEIEAIIAKATAKNPDDRFADVSAFLDALRNGMPVAAPAAPEPVAAIVEQPAQPAAEALSAEPVAPVAAPERAAEEMPVRVEEPAQAPAPVAQAAHPQPQARRRSRGWLWGLLLLVVVGGGIVGALKFMPGLKLAGGATLYVVPEDLHLWKTAERSGDLGVIPVGEALTVVGDAANGWKEVEWGQKRGFVNANLLVPFEEYQIIHHAMNPGMKHWLNKSFLRISLAHYFHEEGLYADLPDKTFETVYGKKRGGLEVWRADASPSDQQEYNAVIRGVQLEAGPYDAKNGRQLDHVVILTSEGGQGGPQRRLVAFRHMKDGDGYESSVIDTYDLTDNPEYEVRIASSDKLRWYMFEGKNDLLLRLNRSQYPILLANPKNDFIGTVLAVENGKFKAYEVSKGFEEF